MPTKLGLQVCVPSSHHACTNVLTFQSLLSGTIRQALLQVLMMLQTKPLVTYSLGIDAANLILLSGCFIISFDGFIVTMICEPSLATSSVCK